MFTVTLKVASSPQFVHDRLRVFKTSSSVYFMRRERRFTPTNLWPSPGSRTGWSRRRRRRRRRTAYAAACSQFSACCWRSASVLAQAVHRPTPGCSRKMNWRLPRSTANTHHRCKKRFFILVTFVTFFDGFLFFRRFYFKKTLAKFRAASKLTRSTFKITATKLTYDFSVACRTYRNASP